MTGYRGWSRDGVMNKHHRGGTYSVSEQVQPCSQLVAINGSDLTSSPTPSSFPRAPVPSSATFKVELRWDFLEETSPWSSRSRQCPEAPGTAGVTWRPGLARSHCVTWLIPVLSAWRTLCREASVHLGTWWPFCRDPPAYIAWTWDNLLRGMKSGIRTPKHETTGRRERTLHLCSLSPHVNL